MALFVLWLGYWMPSLVRRRTELADARVTDRFSAGLRIVAMSGSGSRPGSRRGGAMVTDGNRRTAGQGVPRVTRPTPKGHPLQIMVRGRPLTAERIRRVERRARRAARARRRFIVSVFLLVWSVVSWAFVGFGTLHWGLAAAPSAMLVFVLFLGRRAARAARRADARWTATVREARQRATQERVLAHGGPYAPRNRAQVVGLATRGSDTLTQAIPQVGGMSGGVSGAGMSRGAGKNVLDEILDGPKKARVIEVQVEEQSADPVEKDERPTGRAWDPVPVPLPTYVTKAAAPRRQPVALPPAASSGARASSGASGASGRQVASGAGAGSGGASASAAKADADAVAEDELLRGEPPRMKSETLATPLEEILARRRAAG